jgi:hypothetical protein
MEDRVFLLSGSKELMCIQKEKLHSEGRALLVQGVGSELIVQGEFQWHLKVQNSSDWEQQAGLALCALLS